MSFGGMLVKGAAQRLKETCIDVSSVGALDANTKRCWVARSLATNIDNDALFADGYVDHCAIHARADVCRDRNVGELRLRALCGIKLEHAFEDCKMSGLDSLSPLR